MTIGAGIGVVGVWAAIVVIIVILNTKLNITHAGLSPFGVLILASIACGATYYLAGGH